MANVNGFAEEASQQLTDTLRTGQNGRHFADDNWTKSLDIQLQFSWNMFLVVQLTMSQLWLPPYEPMVAQFTDAYMRHLASMS